MVRLRERLQTGPLNNSGDDFRNRRAEVAGGAHPSDARTVLSCRSISLKTRPPNPRPQSARKVRRGLPQFAVVPGLFDVIISSRLAWLDRSGKLELVL